ncbi:hypothetical protein OO010_12595 [Flavobacteriaceae bacterium KMM 6898]|nr:hypothetical protein [Flavobacteriaceae bacterium KMM 6898]
MKNKKLIFSDSLSVSEMNKIFGGGRIDTKSQGDSCDVLYDSNDNGQMDEGECMEIVECK